MAKPNFSAILEAANPTPKQQVATPQPKARPTKAKGKATPLATPRPSARTNRKGVLVYITKAGHRELATLSLDLERPLQSMMVEAINDYLSKNKRNPIA